MKNLFSKVFNHSAFLEKPPVLVDIGASGELHQEWKLIAPFSICIAFDADTRDFYVSEKNNSGYKKLYLINRIVAAEASQGLDFYLTRSPYCSSALPPDNAALEPWAFSKLFDVEEKISMQAVRLDQTLENIGVKYVDWYKTDSQGTDLRIFDSLSEKVKNNIIVAEFEPGIIDAYLGEDKLHHLMAYMDKRPFWVTDMHIKGSSRIDQEDLMSLNFIQRKGFRSVLRTAPGWCEIAYINKFEFSFGIREYLLGWVCSTIKKEHGFALHLAKQGVENFQDPIFTDLQKYSLRLLTKIDIRFALWASKHIFNKIIRR